MSKSKKIFGVFNILDLVIIGVVLIAVIFAAVKIMSNKGEVVVESSSKECYVEFFVEEVQDFIQGHIKEGDLVKDALQSNVLGTVTKVEYGDSIDFNPNRDGVLVSSSKEGYVSCRVEIKTNGQMTNSGLSINSYNYYINKSMEVRFGDVALYVRLSNIMER